MAHKASIKKTALPELSKSNSNDAQHSTPIFTTLSRYTLKPHANAVQPTLESSPKKPITSQNQNSPDYINTIHKPTLLTTSNNNSQSISSSVININTAATNATKINCDKCDGKHLSSSCPYFKKERETHPDAQRGNKKLGGTSSLPGATLRSARVIRQPGDGSCLFHSMSYGLQDGSNAQSLRRDICNFIEKNQSVLIADTPLSDWIKWDSAGGSVSSYTRKMSGGAWGGGIEMASTSIMKGVNVHVYERSMLSGLVRISAFDHPVSPELKKTVRVLYCGGVHFDAIQ